MKEAMLDILRRHVAEFRKPWPGLEHGKAIIGNAIIGAARDAGATDAEIREAMALAPPPRTALV